MSKQKKKVKFNYKNIAIAAVLLLIIISLLVYFIFFRKPKETTGSQDGGVTQITDSTSYSIRSNATDYQKELYQELKDAIKAEDNQATAVLVVKNFVADFYTLSNKTIKNDVGGAQFWRAETRLEFRNKAMDTYYSNLELYIRDYGKENLPVVDHVTVTQAGDLIGGEGKTYLVCVTWTYVDNNFDTSDFQNYGYFEVANDNGVFYIYRLYY